MLLTRRLDRARARPLGFVATDYALAIWCLGDVAAMIDAGTPRPRRTVRRGHAGRRSRRLAGDNDLLRRTFRANAIIAGLIEKRHPGKEKTGRQMTVSSDLIYDVLRQHEPDHILLKATWADAATGHLDLARLGTFLQRAQGKLLHRALDQVSPLAVPVLLEIGRESVRGEDRDLILREAADDLVKLAMG